jgi:uncharacterized protein with PIN domain
MNESWRKYRIEPLLPKRQASCCRCARPFKTEINPEIRGDFGEIIRGERQVFRLCPGCRADDGFDYERGRKVDAHAQG